MSGSVLFPRGTDRGDSPVCKGGDRRSAHNHYGERCNEIVFTGVDLDEALLRSSLDKALMTDRELALGREGWVPSLIRSWRGIENDYQCI